MTTCSGPDQNNNIYCTDNNTYKFTFVPSTVPNPSSNRYILELRGFLPINPNMEYINNTTFNPKNYTITDPISNLDVTLYDFFNTYAETDAVTSNYYYNLSGTTSLNNCLSNTTCQQIPPTYQMPPSFQMMIGGDGVYSDNKSFSQESLIAQFTDGATYIANNDSWQYFPFGSVTKPWLLNNFHFRTNILGSQQCIDACVGNNYINFSLALGVVILFDFNAYSTWLQNNQNTMSALPNTPIISPFTIITPQKNKPKIITPQKNKPEKIIVFPRNQTTWLYFVLFLVFLIILILLVIILAKAASNNKKTL
jgi:hypothetical protein